jgi:hypothetical protein
VTREHRIATRAYPIKTAARAGTLTVTERADRIAMRLTFDRYGDLGDEVAILKQLLPLLAPFDRDPRPLDFDAPDIGSRLVIDTDTDGRTFAVATEEPRQ